MATVSTAKICCLFSVDNNYDQPSNNLVAWWFHKPSIDMVAKAIGVQFPHQVDDAVTMAVVNIWSERIIGDSTKSSHRIDGTDYRIEWVMEGKVNAP